MIPKHIQLEIERLQKNIEIKKDRIAGLNDLAKIKNIKLIAKFLISDYDLTIKMCDDTINSVTQSKELKNAHEEQVITHSMGLVKLVTQGFKATLCDSEKQIVMLNNAIEQDNLKIKDLEESYKKGNTHGRDII